MTGNQVIIKGKQSGKPGTPEILQNLSSTNLPNISIEKEVVLDIVQGLHYSYVATNAANNINKIPYALSKV